ncbi:MAG: bifunctional 2-polyprenyl-6-hydroxyphenol methylase/3-demethylubiquinol 3-O-methyltransferase UbiG [Hyphomicrobiales bacterium]|nr:bifunctional 2-polyprenyl-6-hydroxyphenol methylase/3-demethylubiquinol 3-O-methyltransferase UbiG [Hyphomicrobiales bacterium]
MAATTKTNARRSGSHSTVDAAEIGRFDALADRWWDANGPMKPLHSMNPVRLGFIREQVISHFGLDRRIIAPLAGLAVADVGCGGGLLSEPLARMGGTVTGLDPATQNIAVAKAHAVRMELDIRYLPTTIEDIVADGERFDVVTALEVVEHVADVPAFLGALSSALKPGGLLVMSTLNRTLRSYAAAIIGAEYIMRWLPKGTHDWNKFIRPVELERGLNEAGLQVLETRGMVPDPFRIGWRLADDTAVNYILAAARAQ